MSRMIRGIGQQGDANIRSALKAQFDELLDAAAAQRARNYDNPENKPSVVYLATQLMGKVLGEIAHIPFETEDDAPSATRYALMQWLPTFSRQEDLELWSELLDELLLMPIGGRPSLLVPKGKRRGKPDVKLTLMRLAALKWDAFLNGRSNLSAAGYQLEISEAFGASSWDTVRHWSTIEVRPVIEEYLEDARQGVGEGLCYPDYEENLWRDGNRYRTQAGLPTISREDFMKKIGKSSR